MDDQNCWVFQAMLNGGVDLRLPETELRGLCVVDG